ncbi:hypothetical protein [Thalassorhabdomicrobium marinisediminis]|uniref:hypothetical protein n=1 Tax=Thalassorhabdomicrobium marinisediminis TaxID=2170577 RepID=UPI002490D818|nr:hypothetical protein [Thalassorhabdomicrobium marinisediminis]
MSEAPPLEAGEVLLHHHRPDLAAFRHTALVLLAVTLVPTLAMVAAFPDSLWGAAPLFIACLLLMQERVTLGRHAAWITNRRILLQNAAPVALRNIATTNVVGNAVRLRTVDPARRVTLSYPSDKTALRDVIDTARQEAP